MKIFRPVAYHLRVTTDYLSGVDTPAAEAIKTARQAAELSQGEAGALIGRTAHDWYRYESGARSMDRAVWALFLLSVGAHPKSLTHTPKR